MILVSLRGDRVAKRIRLEYSKKLVADIRSLLWVVTIGGLVLALLCILLEFEGSLPWVATMVGLPWSAHGVVCACYLGMSKSDHRTGGITYETAKAAGFKQDKQDENEKSPAI